MVIRLCHPGQSILSQSQSPNALPYEIRKLCYSAKPYKRRLEIGSESDDKKSESKAPVEEFGLANEFLLRSGFEIVDSTGSSESPPVTGWDVGTATPPAAIIYVIDASEEISREVKEDLHQLLLGCSNSHLIFVLNKIDALFADGGEIDEDRLASRRSRVLATLKQLGFCASTDGEDVAKNFFSLSCRKLKIIRKKTTDSETSEIEFNNIWMKDMDRLRQVLLGCLATRLKQQLQHLLPLLEEASKLFDSQATRAGDLRESKKQAWKNILDLAHRVSQRLQQSTSQEEIVALVEQIRAKLKAKKPEIVEVMRTLEMKEPAQPQQQEKRQQQPQQGWAEAEIERQVRELQQQCCQDWADAYLAERLRATDDVIAKLTSFQDYRFDGQLAPNVDKKIVFNLDFDKSTNLTATSTLTRRLSGNKTELFRSRLSRQNSAWTDPKWRMETAKKLMGTTEMKSALKQSVEQLNNLIHAIQTDTSIAVNLAANKVDTYLADLKKQKKSLRESSLVCLKLWLRIHSVLTSTHCKKLLTQNLCCIAVGCHGNPVFAEKRINPESGKALVVKKLFLDDEDLDAMAGALHYSCTSTRDFLLHTEHLQLKKLNNKPNLWKLLIWTERMPPSLEQTINEICQTCSLADRLRIGLSIAEALAQLHRDKRPHLNLQLSNIFVSPENRSVRLADLGLARSIRLLLYRRQTTFSTTTVAPELLPQPAHSATVGKIRSVNRTSADAFSLGVVLKALVFGCEIPSPFEELNAEISQLIEECTNSNPGLRPTPADVAERLRRYIHSGCLSLE